MSRARKWGVAITLIVFAIAAGACGWFLSRYDPDTASKYAGLIQAVTAVFALCGVVFTVMALSSPAAAAPHVQKNRAGDGGVVIASQNGDVYTDGHVPGRGAAGEKRRASGG